MKWLCLILIGGAALSAHGQALRRIDLSKQADDVNHKFISTDQLTMPTLTQPACPTRVAPLGENRFEPKSVQTHGLDLSTVPADAYPTRTLPRQNFAAKRAAQSPATLDQPRATTGPAPINGRKILANTPAGQEDLKNQLNKLP